ncbi:hypothetical protein ACIBF1_33040 [Spirillospora sp. NPDC050679]
MTPEGEPFAVPIPDRGLADLHVRLDLVRLPESETVPDATQGIRSRQLVALLNASRACT